MDRLRTSMNGFTFIEIMVVMAMVIVVVSMTVPRLFNTIGSGGGDTITTAQDLAHLFAVARANATANRENDHWSVHIVDDGTTDCGSTTTVDCAVLYKGTNFSARTTTYDQTFILAGGKRWGQIDDTDFYFNKQTGMVRGILSDVIPEPVAYWSFEATSTVDTTLNGHDAVDYGGLAQRQAQGQTNGKSWYAWNGGSGGLEVPDHVALQSSAFSVSGWVRTEGAGDNWDDNSVVIAKTTAGTTDGWQMYIPAGSNKYCFFVGEKDSNHELCSGTYASQGSYAWHYFVATVNDSGQFNFYIDTVSVGAAKDVSDEWPRDVSSSHLTMLTNYDGSIDTTMGLDEVGYFDRVLTTTEMGQGYNAFAWDSLWPNTSLNLYVTDGFATSTVTLLTSGVARVANYDIGYVYESY